MEKWTKEIREKKTEMGIEHKDLEKRIGKVTRVSFILPEFMAVIVPVRRLLYPKRRGEDG